MSSVLLGLLIELIIIFVVSINLYNCYKPNLKFPADNETNISEVTFIYRNILTENKQY